MGNEAELRALIAELLSVPAQEICDLSSPLTLPAWDSLNHLKLIVAIEESFGVSFTTPEVSDICTYADIKQALRNKGVALGT